MLSWAGLYSAANGGKAGGRYRAARRRARASSASSRFISSARRRRRIRSLKRVTNASTRSAGRFSGARTRSVSRTRRALTVRVRLRLRTILTFTRPVLSRRGPVPPGRSEYPEEPPARRRAGGLPHRVELACQLLDPAQVDPLRLLLLLPRRLDHR